MLSFLTPYLGWIKIAGVVVAAALLFGAGWKVKGWKDDAAQLAAVNSAVESYKADEARNHRLAEQHIAEEQEKDRVANQLQHALIKVVDRPVYRDCRIDADGLRLLNAAIAGTADPGRKPDGAVPSGDAAGRHDDGRTGAEGAGAGVAPQ